MQHSNLSTKKTENISYLKVSIFGPGTKDISSSLCVQTRSEAHPASCPMGTGVPRSKMSRSYTSSPPSAFAACSGIALALTLWHYLCG
jgi:hypothetical protein